ncbi:IS21 family transposase [bacterium]|nr:IS21 family transposase [bacterium]
MTQVHNIRKLYFEEGKNINQISKETGFDRKTVRNFLKKDNFNNSLPPAAYVAGYPKLGPFKPEIDNWLSDDKKAKPKQRHTAKRVFDRLRNKYSDSFDCSYRTVAGYVAGRKKEIFTKKTGVLPLEHIPGEAQVDFGDCQFYERQRLCDGKYLNLSFPSSNKGYFQVFKGENAECLFEGLKTIFEHIGGVPNKLWFDNASTIVTKVLKDGQRNLTNDFLRFKEHYRFEANFCNVSSGYEKGSIESKVGYHRRNMLVPIPRFNSIIDFNKELLLLCEKDAKREHYRKEASHEELYQSDKLALLKLPQEAFDACKYTTLRTNGYGRFYLNNGLHEYSVSPKYKNSRVLVKITAFEVIALDDSYREIVVHERFYGDFKQQSMKWLPYLTQLSRCPGALKYTGIYQMLPEPMQQYLEKCNKSQKGKVLQAIASLTENNGFEEALVTVGSALDYSAADADSLVSLHNRLNTKVVHLEPIKLAGNVPHLKKYIPNLHAYDRSLLKAGEDQC